jgi:hypothetical protein
MATIKNISSGERSIEKLKIKPGETVEVDEALAREFQDDPVFQVTLNAPEKKNKKEKD